MTSFFDIVLGGVFHASVLFLVAAGLQLVFGVQRIVNLACGSFYALGAYFGISAVGWATQWGAPSWAFLPVLLLSGVALAAIGPFIELILRTVYRRDEAFQLLLTFAFVCADAFVPLAIQEWRGAPAIVSGLVFTASTLTWTAGAWIQAHRIDRFGPRRFLTAGFAIVIVGIVVAIMAVGTGVAIASGALGSDAEKQAFLNDAAKRLDVTPAELITAIVTDRGVVRPPYRFAADDE